MAKKQAKQTRKPKASEVAQIAGKPSTNEAQKTPGKAVKTMTAEESLSFWLKPRQRKILRFYGDKRVLYDPATWMGVKKAVGDGADALKAFPDEAILIAYHMTR